MSHEQAGTLRAGEYYFDLIMLLVSLVVLFLAYQISGFQLCAAGTFPLASSAVMVLSMLLSLRSSRIKRRAGTARGSEELKLVMESVFTRDVLVYACLAVLYILAIDLLHFLPTSFVFIALSIIYLKGSTPIKAIVISAGTLFSIYMIFQYFFQVLLP